MGLGLGFYWDFGGGVSIIKVTNCHHFGQQDWGTEIWGSVNMHHESDENLGCVMIHLTVEGTQCY